MNIPARYENVKWEDVPENIQELFKALGSSRKGLYLHGGVGTGKTHIAYALYKEYKRARLILKRRKTWEGETDSFEEWEPTFWNITELLLEIRSDFDRNSENKRRVVEELMDYRGILFIDDIGSEKVTDWTMETFYLIVNKRYNEKLPIIFTSNCNVRELADRLGSAGDKIVSRIVETCDIIKVEGEDRRLKK